MAALNRAIVLSWRRPPAHPPFHPLDVIPFPRANVNALNSSSSTSDSAHRLLAAASWRYKPQLLQKDRSRCRGERVVVRAGPASTNVLIFAFVFPLSLIIGTVLVSIRIADSLDEKYLDELAMNKAIMEENEAEEDLDDEANREGEEKNTESITEVEQKPVPEAAGSASRRRNRPRRRQ